MSRKPVHVAMFSGGAASAYVAYLMVQARGKENSILFFTDTLWEHPDNYRFMQDVADHLGMEITRRVDGRTPDEVFEETRFLGNSRLAKCSSELKVRQTVIFLEELRLNGYEPILYFGIGSHEKHRQESIRAFYEHQGTEPVESRFPLLDADTDDKEIKRIIEEDWKIKLPEMYYLGFSHANCGGRCVRGGLNHYAHLYKVWPEVYKEQEEMENKMRELLQKDVTILKRDGKPLSLHDYRKELEESNNCYDVKEDDTVPCVCVF